ncbi:MAG: hypothetical protein KDA37_08605 [Planctomycetales bacterium]|nr:hypothetical protein [Planctomycetales bacterium]
MRASIVLALVAFTTHGSCALADSLQWQPSFNGTAQAEPAQASSPRAAARFQRPDIAQRAKRPTLQEPARVAPSKARLILEPAPQQPGGATAGQSRQRDNRIAPAAHVQRGRVRMARQATEVMGGEVISTPTPTPSPAPMMGGPVAPDHELFEPYHEAGVCDCPECSCACPDPGCGFVEPGCGCVEPGCGCVDGCCDMPTCGFPEADCCCGDVGCCGECCGDGCGDCCGCGEPHCLGGCVERGAIPLCIYIPPIKEVTAFGGVHGFKGGLDQYRDRGNFGFHEGVNLGGKMAWLPWPGLGYQVGYQAVHSQMHGSSVDANYYDSHTQHFLTAGLFRRSCVGFQYGVVYDMMRDERIESTSFHQVRGLLSVTNPKGHEIGFQFNVSSDSERLTGNNGTDTWTYQPIDQYLGFWRFNSCHGGDFRAFAGGGGGYGILGGDLYAPLNNSWSLQTGFTYFIPDGSVNTMTATEEGWNLSINLVWHYGCSAKRFFNSPWRPMFNVADNGSFFVEDVD